MSSPAQDFGITVTRDRDAILVAARGELDLETAPLVRAEIRTARRRGAERIVLDLRGVTFMDSAGVALVLMAHREAPDGRFTLRCGDGQPRHVLEITGMLDVVALEPDAGIAAP